VANKNIPFDELDREMQKLTDLVVKGFGDSIKEYVTDLTGRLFDNSPVLTGLYRSNHNVSIGSRFMGTFAITDKVTVMGDAKSKINEFDPVRDSTIFIQNNLDYAEALENGHSKQAPSGIYGQTVFGSSFNLKIKGV
jgi:hypothetical protein